MPQIQHVLPGTLPLRAQLLIIGGSSLVFTLMNGTPGDGATRYVHVTVHEFKSEEALHRLVPSLQLNEAPSCLFNQIGDFGTFLIATPLLFLDEQG